MDDKVLDVKELFGKFKSSLEVKNYAKDLFLRLQVATKRIEDLQQEITHLKSLLTTNPKFELISAEQLTCEMEIKRIEETSRSRPLSLEEAKIFDIMTKNLIAIKRAKKEEKSDPIDITEDVTTLLTMVKADDKQESSNT